MFNDSCAFLRYQGSGNGRILPDSTSIDFGVADARLTLTNTDKALSFQNLWQMNYLNNELNAIQWANRCLYLIRSESPIHN